MGQYVRNEVRFPADGGIELAAWLYLPEGSVPRPAITMAHGFAGTREHGIEAFAKVFAEEGFVVLLHDHRSFGISGGEPRQDVDPWRQIADWRRAISYLESRPEVDATRIGIWGTSYAGGHAIVLGASDRRLRAVVSQVPIINGYEQGLRRVAPEALPILEELLAEDDRAQLRGEAPRYQAVVSADPSVPAAYRAKETIDFYLQPVSEGSWENKVTVRSTLASRMYEPGHFIARVSPTPLLMVIANDDKVTLTDLELAAYERALEPKKLELIPGGHFDPYVRQFEKASTAALRWFQRWLLVAIFSSFYLMNVQATPFNKNQPDMIQESNHETQTLHWKLFTVKRPGLVRDPNMPAGGDDLKWVVNSSTLIYGKRDAVLVDVFLTIDQSKALADSIAATGKNLKYIYITHAHGDHFFGAQLLLDRFPDAKVISTQAIADDCAEAIKPDVIKSFWEPRYPGQISQKLVIPQAVQGEEFELEGEKLVIVQTGFSDTHHSTSLYVPSIELIVAGDVVYNGIHPYLAETSPQTRKEWIAALDKLMGLHPRFVIAGHKNPSNDDSPDNITATKKYLEDFDRLIGETSTNLELYNKMQALHPGRANPGSLWGAALAAKK
jgi:glyoxylase-like metal-dependent hydrolase (beta-lactamase superfamily II)/cephalosporin-C deacetylase-like acetyl esterase